MRRIRDTKENESLDNAREAFDRFSYQKHNRWNVMRFEENLEGNLNTVLQQIIEESFTPHGYKEKWIYVKKPRKLAKAPVFDHVAEAAAMLPFEQQVYDHIAWFAPAVRPGLGTHALMRFIRNSLFASSQKDLYYYFTCDVHHYFPLMDHELLHKKVDNTFKQGKFRRLVHRVVASYRQGAPLGIKMAQLFGMLYLADFDRLVSRFFNIPGDPDKMAYWTQRYITEWILTAQTPDEYRILTLGPQRLASRFERFARKGIPHYIRFVDNILVMHEDKVFLRIVRELVIVHLVRDYRCEVNGDYQVRPTWMGIRLCGYTFFHEKVEVSKRNKQNVARRARRLWKLKYNEEQIRVRLASQFGYIIHANSINLIKTLGMEKTLGKIIRNRRVKPPFKGMNPNQKVPFSSLVVKDEADIKTKIYLLDYTVTDSKIDKETVTVYEQDSSGQAKNITKQVPSKVLAIRFKKIIKTFTKTGPDGEEQNTYLFKKQTDEEGNPSEIDAEYYAFTGSRIMIDQAENDFGPEDLPVATVIMQVRGKDGKSYTKFT